MKRIIFIILLSAVTFSAFSVEAAAIKGKITYKGKRPKLREIKMGADPICLTKHDDAVLPKTIIITIRAGGPTNPCYICFHIGIGRAKRVKTSGSGVTATVMKSN